MDSSRSLRLGTRASALARWQANWVAQRLRDLGVDVALVPISTSGDQSQTQAIGAIGGEGLFTKELGRALLDGHIDMAVHSLKDLPTERVPGLCLAAVPPRGPVCDVLACRAPGTLADLPPGATIGTGSLRRRAQLLHARPDVRMCDVRGNVDTRLRKLQAGDFDALVLAQAGLARLELLDRDWQVLPTSVMLPAVGQGALGIETRDDDRATLARLMALDDLAAHRAVAAERAMLAALCGGCLAPVGGWGRVEQDGLLHLSGVVLNGDGTQRIFAQGSDQLDAALELGRRVADELLTQGAAELIRGTRQSR
jgi:hydroxymethylbilane synthase